MPVATSPGGMAWNPNLPSTRRGRIFGKFGGEVLLFHYSIVLAFIGLANY
jgi:hypothetical protein